MAQKDQCAQHLHLSDHLVTESENTISFRKTLPLYYIAVIEAPLQGRLLTAGTALVVATVCPTGRVVPLIVTVARAAQ